MMKSPIFFLILSLKPPESNHISPFDYSTKSLPVFDRLSIQSVL